MESKKQEVFMQTDREARIQQRAYEIWVDEGRPEGLETLHWQQAEEELGLSASDPVEVSPAVKSLRKEKRLQKSAKTDDQLTEGLKGTFPASDPVSITEPYSNNR
jgi:hypothetical protein